MSIVNIFLLNANPSWLVKDSIPLQTLQSINLVDYFETSFLNSQLPIIFGKSTISRSAGVTSIDFDIFGTIFLFCQGMRRQ